MRHGRLGKTEYVKKESNYDIKLNDAINDLRSQMPKQWEIILDYIDTQATMLKTDGLTSEEIIRLVERKQGAAEIFYRLSRVLKEK